MALTQDQLLSYFSDELSVDTSEIEPDTPLFSSGIVDSFAIVELLLFLEKSTGQRMNPDDISLENLDTVNLIVEFANSRQAG